MSHPRELLSAFLDGELPADERLRVEQHLAACSDCAAELRELALVDEWAKAEQLEAPDGYFEALPGRVRARLRKTAPRRARRVVPQWAWAAAALVLVGLLIPLAWTRRTPQAPQGPVATAPLSEHAPAPASAPMAAPTAPPALPELARQAPREAAEHAPAQPPAVKPAAPRAGFAAPPEAAPAPQDAAAAARDDLKGLGYLGESKQDGERRARAPEPAAAVEGEVDRVATREELRLQGRAQEAVGGAAPGQKSVQAFEDRNERSGADRRSAAARPESSVKRKLEAARPAEEFAGLLAKTARTASEARALRLVWRTFAETQRGDARADEARVRAIEAAALAFTLSRETVDRDTLERDAADYLERTDAGQRQRVETLVRATLN